MIFDDYLAQWRRPGWLPRRLRHDARMEVLDRAAYASPGKFANTYASAAAAMIVAADRIAELEAALRAIADEVREAHDGGCIWPVRKILHKAGFNAGIVRDAKNG